MKKGDRVRTIEDFPSWGVSHRNVGIVISQHKYRLSKGRGSINPNRGWDVEVKFRHKVGTCIFQGEELRVLPPKRLRHPKIYKRVQVLVDRRWRNAQFYGTTKADNTGNYLLEGGGIKWVHPSRVRTK